MDIPNNVLSFRKSLANDIQQLRDLLYGAGLSIQGDLSQVINELKSSRAKVHPEGDDTVATFWGYELKNFRILFENNPRHIYPEEVSNLSLIFEVHVVADHNDLEEIQDPFKYLTFNILVEGDNGEKSYINAMHLDRHLGGDTQEAHPIYHFHFGGDRLNKKERKFGDALFLDAPRLMHYPMDFILGMDFILSNYFPEAWQTLKKDGKYIGLLEKYQAYFWKPFVYAIANHWKDYNPAVVSWKAHDVLPTLMPPR